MECKRQNGAHLKRNDKMEPTLKVDSIFEIMQIHHNQYYHIYNRSNNSEIVFKKHEHYLFFLRKYRKYFDNDLDTIGYCLMPTHFHFLVFIRSENLEIIKKNFGILLSSYTKAINKSEKRHGSLFQLHTKAKHVDDEKYLFTLLTYIHQNSIRSKLVTRLDAWEYSSYLDYVGKRNGSLPNKDLILSSFNSVEEFQNFSETMLNNIEKKYWI